MVRCTLRCLLLLTIGPAVLAAQVREQPPMYRGPQTVIPGVFVTPIAGVPFTATVIVHSQQTLPDGSTETRVRQDIVARDSKGRIRNERHMLMPEGYKGTSPMVGALIFDPAGRVSTMLNPFTRIARQRTIASPPASTAPAGPNVQDLGYTTLNGIQAKGTRTTRTVPAAFSGTGKPVEVVDETWYSEELHMNIMEEHTDVRGGKQTVALLSINRTEPPQSLFEVPQGYKVVDVNPPADGQ